MSGARWLEVQLPSGALNMGDVRLYTKGDLQVIVAREPHGRTDRLLWHLSISAADRYPSWDEICDPATRSSPTT